MPTTWIIAANAGRARILAEEDPTARLKEVNDMVNTAVRVQTAELVADDLGQRSAGKSRHSTGAPIPQSGYEPNQAPEEHQTELFARSINDFLLGGFNAGKFQKLVLIASPQFLGLLRKLLDPHLAAIVAIDINKDYTQLDLRKLQENVQAQMQAG